MKVTRKQERLLRRALNEWGQRRPEGIAAEPLPVHGDACQGARQTLMFVSA